MTQQRRIRIDLPNTAVEPKHRRKCMVSRGLHHVPREHGSRDAMFSENMTLALTKPGNIVWTNHDRVP